MKGMNMERLLRLVADYHSFCNEDYGKANETDPDELSAEELDAVAAATGALTQEPERKNGKKDG